jgi:mannose-1-phosphate guanylyltransferase
VVIPSSFGWSDVGSWSALPEVLAPDADGNVIINAERVVSLDSRDNLVRGGERLVALLGVRDLIVVDTGDALLICPKDRAQDVKRVTEALEEKGCTDLL